MMPLVAKGCQSVTGDVLGDLVLGGHGVVGRQ